MCGGGCELSPWCLNHSLKHGAPELIVITRASLGDICETNGSGGGGGCPVGNIW